MTVNAACDVTVVIPTRNRAGFLSGALRSALAQVDVSYEIRIVDDGSTDGTAELLNGCLDSRMTYVRHASSRGVATARNRAALDARGEWLAFLDDDDLWAPTWLRTGLQIARMQGAGAVYGSRWVIDERRRVVGALLAPHPSQLRASLDHQNVLGGPSAVMVRADVLAAAGGFDERLSALADWEAWLRVVDTCRAVPVPELLTAYTSHSANMHARDPFGVLAEFQSFARIVDARGGTVDPARDEEFIRWLALDSSRAGHQRRAARLWLRNARQTRKPQHVLRAGLTLIHGETSERSTFARPAWLAALGHAPPVTDWADWAQGSVCDERGLAAEPDPRRLTALQTGGSHHR